MTYIRLRNINFRMAEWLRNRIALYYDGPGRPVVSGTVLYIPADVDTLDAMRRILPASLVRRINDPNNEMEWE